MQRNNTLILISIVLFNTIFSSCAHTSSKVNKTIDHATNVIGQHPDNALTSLDSLAYPSNLSKSQYNRFMLLLLQAKDKNNKDLISDTAIWDVRNYYIKKKDFPNAAMAAYYCGRVSTEQKCYNRALFHYLEAKKYASHIPNLNLKGLIQSEIGYVLSRQFLESEAMPHFHKAASYFHKANNIKNEAIVYLSIGASFLAEEQVDSALHYETIALKTAETLKNRPLISSAKQNISFSYQKQNSFFTLEKQKILLYSSLEFITLIAGIFFYYRKYTLNKKHELESKQKIQHLIKTCENYNTREVSFQNILLHQFEILRKTIALESCKQQLNGNNRSKQLISKFNEIVYGQDSLNWDRLYEVMNELHNGFFERLRNKFPNLNEDEFRICCLTYAKFNSTEISTIMGLSVNTIQMKRSSIRKKLGIKHMGNIPNFLNNISHHF